MKITITLDRMTDRNQLFWSKRIKSLLKSGYVAIPKKCGNGQIYEIEISGIDNTKIESLVDGLSKNAD